MHSPYSDSKQYNSFFVRLSRKRKYSLEKFVWHNSTASFVSACFGQIAYRVLVKTPGRRTPLRRCKRKWENNIEVLYLSILLHFYNTNHIKCYIKLYINFFILQFLLLCNTLLIWFHSSRHVSAFIGHLQVFHFSGQNCYLCYHLLFY
jgi:hypothetical protein